MDAPLTWSVWPARERPLVAALAIAGVAGFAWTAGAVAESAVVGAGVTVVLLLSLQRFLLPVHCSISSTEAVVRTALRLRRFPTSAVRRVAYDDRALLLAGAGTRPAFARGLLMPLPAADSDRLAREASAVLDRGGQ